MELREQCRNQASHFAGVAGSGNTNSPDAPPLLRPVIERIYVGCCATDVWLARISVASIRYWHPDAPICLLRDHGMGFADTAEIEKYWGVDVLD